MYLLPYEDQEDFYSVFEQKHPDPPESMWPYPPYPWQKWYPCRSENNPWAAEHLRSLVSPKIKKVLNKKEKFLKFKISIINLKRNIKKLVGKKFAWIYTLKIF